jgi:hypothetical protein
MIQWKYTLNLKDLWEARESRNITIAELGKLVGKRVEKLQIKPKDYYCGEDGMLDDIAYEFAIVETVEEFDNVLEQFYNFADRYRIWVRTC